jgi:hypothetical protein
MSWADAMKNFLDFPFFPQNAGALPGGAGGIRRLV